MKPEPSQNNLFYTLIQQGAEAVFSPLENFIRKQAAAGTLLLLAVIVSLVAVNSPWEMALQALSEIRLGVTLQSYAFNLSVAEWIGDGLLALFFFLMGLEIKRELLIGQLRQPQQAMLLLIAGVGGMVVPALLYWLCNQDGPAQHGWAIPMTTDTAFAIGVLAMLAKRVSIQASIFLTVLAIIDDIVSIIVIACFYTHDFNVSAFTNAMVPLGLLVICNAFGFRRGWIYALLGIILWYYIHESGVHATLAGLLLALTVPARPQIGQRNFIDRIKKYIFEYEAGKKAGQGILRSDNQHQLTMNMETAIMSASTPLQRWHGFLENPIAIVVLPLFALFNAGIHLSLASFGSAFASPVAWGIVIGLVIGKPVGIVLFSLVAVHLRIGTIPSGMTFGELVGVGLLSGIGFTMSFFIVALGFEHEPNLIEPAKIGILVASVVATFLSVVWIRCLSPAKLAI